MLKMASSATSAAWLTEFAAALRATSCQVDARPASLADGIARAQRELATVARRGRNLWWVGNGGSASMCSHFSQDSLNKLGIRSLSLSDPALLTCNANDYGYDQVYRRSLDVLLREGDLLVAISSSGESRNILECALLAGRMNATLLTFSGFAPDNALARRPASSAFHVPSDKYGIVETAHSALLHCILEDLYLREDSTSGPCGRR